MPPAAQESYTSPDRGEGTPVKKGSDPRKAKKLRVGLRLQVPPPKVFRDRRRQAKVNERAAVRRRDHGSPSFSARSAAA